MGSVAKRLGGPVVAIAASVLGLGASPAMAATFTVNTTADPPGAGCTGGTCSLRQAIAAVNAGPGGGDRINLPAGRVVLSLGVLSVSKPVTIAGVGARASIVDANSTSSIINFSAGSSPSAAEDLTFTGGRGSSTSGVNNDVTLRLTRVAVTGNVATTFAAAGIYNDSTGNLTIDGSTISGNSTGTVGGGIYNQNVITITNSTISGNTANTSGSNWEGGGIYTDGTATILNSTIAGNTAFRGGGIDVAGGSTATLRNTIVAQNTATGAGQPGNCRVFGTLTSQGGNLEDTNTCSFIQGTDLRSTPAVLGPLQDNGGPLDTRALLAGSPAIDRGTASGCPATDARGVGRPQQGGCDIGAYEFAPPSVTTGSAGSIGVTSASVAGTMQANLRSTSYRFEYGPTTAYGSATATQDGGAGNSPVSVGAALTGLRAGTTYHYRLVATNAEGTSNGSDRTFSTAPFAGSSLRSRKLVADRKGRVALRVSCPAGTAGGSCTDVAALYAVSGKLPAQAGKRSRRARLLGKARFTVAAGKTVTKRLRLNRSGRRLVKRVRRLRARLLLTSRDGAGNVKTSRHRVTVHARR